MVKGAAVHTDQEDSSIVISRESLRGNKINYEVEVTNSGNYEGAVSVLAFVSSDVRVCVCVIVYLEYRVLVKHYSTYYVCVLSYIRL